ncbi:MAG: hypothetical protein JWM95_2717 [Gemmatimonadetes bacterium]|nr:hypothetical protein [Gemmatimonadota bacterium]
MPEVELRQCSGAMIATGLTFAAGVGAVSSIVGTIMVLAREGSVRELFEMTGKLSVVAFIVGVAFAGTLAITARRRRFAEFPFLASHRWGLAPVFSTSSSLPRMPPVGGPLPTQSPTCWP